jgi:hypothetical protein
LLFRRFWFLQPQSQKEQTFGKHSVNVWVTFGERSVNVR